jgi:hypothetical protein
MTAPSSEKLAKALEERGFAELAKRARTDEFHDFKSKHATPAMELMNELQAIKPRSAAARELIEMHAEGRFDADLQESDEWASSPEGQEAFNRLAKGE